MKKFCITIQISLKCVPKGPIDNNVALIWIMACMALNRRQTII